MHPGIGQSVRSGEQCTVVNCTGKTWALSTILWVKVKVRKKDSRYLVSVDCMLLPHLIFRPCVTVCEVPHYDMTSWRGILDFWRRMTSKLAAATKQV